ncbi:MAG: hypothetical protein JXA42_10650, partial [Anaerolineales bacterium]|nr:hypothetical protein [Anaerolineales bacterium]
VESMPDEQKRELEKELLGFTLTPHPKQKALDELQSRVTAYSGDLAALPDKKQVTLAGIVTWIRPMTTRAGKPMAVVSMEDIQGAFEVVIFSRLWKKQREMVARDKVLLVCGTVDASRGDPKLLATSLDDNPVIYTMVGGQSPIKAPCPDVNLIGRPLPTIAPPETGQITYTPSEPDGDDGAPPPPPPGEWESLGFVQQPEPAPQTVPEESSADGPVMEPSDKDLEIQPPAAPRPDRMVTVFLRPAGMDRIKPLIRQLVQHLSQPEGSDRFCIQVDGVDFALEFPNSFTSWSDGLRQEILAIHGVRDVQAN